MSIIGCILTIELDLIQVSIAMAMQTFFDSMHIAYQKNIDNIKTDSDIGFDFVDSSVR
ncbi:putative transposase [Wolbachia endosymbiont of Cylisticus convexus]|nr:putative transposase [Wolbachia endosymbiont of Cylisticus convexus]